MQLNNIMLLKRLSRLLIATRTRQFHKSPASFKEFPNPISRALGILKNDVLSLAQPFKEDPFEEEKRLAQMGIFPNYTDVLIIGGGAIGSSVAYWLKEKTSREGLRVVVVEKDPKDAQCSTSLSMGELRPHFSLPESVQMSIFGAEFLRTTKKKFGDQADVFYSPLGQLMLASESGAENLISSVDLQRRLGTQSILLSTDQIQERFPWINVEDLEVGALCNEKAGWFDPWALLTLLRSGAEGMGTQFVEGEVVDFNFCERNDILVDGIDEGVYEGLKEVVVKLPNDEYKPIQFSYCIIASGVDSHDVAGLAKVGNGTGVLSLPLPIEKRKRYLYTFNCPENPPGINTPMVYDYMGTYFRRTGLGGSFMAGFSPYSQEEACEDENLSDRDYIEQKIVPVISNRVPAFKSIEITSCRTGHYSHCCFDDNGIVGPHPYYHNLYIATGFSNQGIQQVPAIGRAVAELILDGDFKTIDLTRLGFDRFIVDKPMFEIGAY